MSSRVKATVLNISLSVSVLLATLCSCMADTRYLAFAPVGADGWASTDTLTYSVVPLVGVKQGGVYLLLHTEGYRYGNIAIEVSIRQDTTLLYNGQHSYLLSDNDAKSGIGHRYDYVLPIANITLCDTLATNIILTQQLDQSLLPGIREVGIRIGDVMRQPSEPMWKVDWH